MSDYKIFDTLADFITWQGPDTLSLPGHVNHTMGHNTNSAHKTTRYSYPHPHSTAVFTLDSNGLPQGIIGPNVKVCARIDDECPILDRPTGLVTREAAVLAGFLLDQD